jgi:hypothetical protein
MKQSQVLHEATPGPYALLAPSHGAESLLARFFPFSASIGLPGKPAEFSLERFDAFGDVLSVGTPRYIDQNCVGVCRDEAGITWVARQEESGDLSLAAHAANGSVLSTHALPFGFDPTKQKVAPLPMAARRGSVYIGWQNQLVRFNPDGSKSLTRELPFPIVGLTPSSAHTVTRIIATFAEGCAFVPETENYRLLAQGLLNPVATFTPDGSIIVAGNGSVHVYGRKGPELAFMSSFETYRKPLAVLPAAHGEFAIFDSEGNVDVYRVNP